MNFVLQQVIRIADLNTTTLTEGWLYLQTVVMRWGIKVKGAQKQELIVARKCNM